MTSEPAILPGWLIVATSFGYLTLLFAIAYYGDRRAEQRKSLTGSSSIYSLSIAVYCTAWTFYGSVGRAVSSGVGFLPIYLGPTLMFVLGWVVLRKILRISKRQRITSIADFISSRYGKSQLLGGLVTVIAVIGIMPYISLQLKAVSSSFNVLLNHQAMIEGVAAELPLFGDTALWVAALMALFAILFGTRHIEATEHHQGMVIAIAFESVVKLLAFSCVGLFVTFHMFDGFGDLVARAAAHPELTRMLHFEAAAKDWLPLTILAMMTIFCLPRQFHVTVVENVEEKHLNKAVWMFPLYLLVINIFVLPIAFAGLLTFDGETVDSDTFVLALPMAAKQPALALFAFIGGLSAATGMVIVETVALSTMICNDLIVPLLLRIPWLRLSQRRDLSGLLLGIRRAAIVFIMMIGYLYFQLIGESYALVSIGLVSFAAAAQFAPAILAALYWRGATRRGAVAGISAGFMVWTYTLLLPSFAQSGWLPVSFVEHGLFGIALLKPYELFGLTGFGPIPHALFWSLLLNVGAFACVSVVDRQSKIEQIQATLFVEAFRQTTPETGAAPLPGRVTVSDLRAVAERFLGRERTADLFWEYEQTRSVDATDMVYADSDLLQYVERRLSGAIGAASARVMVASTVKREGVGPEEIMQILDETSQVLEYSRQLEEKSHQLEIKSRQLELKSQQLELNSRKLERMARELQAANAQLKQLDHLKDEFLSTVTHELRTPLTSIRSFSEILHDSPDLDLNERLHFLSIVIRESERLTRLINQVLDLTKMETGKMKWEMIEVSMPEVIDHCVTSMRQLFDDKGITVSVRAREDLRPIHADRDQIIQLVINLLSNAQKFAPAGTGRIDVAVEGGDDGVFMRIGDNGPGIPASEHEKIFEKFHQVRQGQTGNPGGSGLGLAICRGIVEHLGGRIWVDSVPGEGATFHCFLPYVQPAESDDPSKAADGSLDTAVRTTVP